MNRDTPQALADQAEAEWSAAWEADTAARPGLLRQRHEALKNGKAKPVEPVVKPEPAPPPTDRRKKERRQGLTAADVMMAAAKLLPQPFSQSALVIACWKAAPWFFGLPEHEQGHPSEARVRNTLYGRAGPLAWGQLVKAGKLFRVVGKETTP